MVSQVGFLKTIVCEKHDLTLGLTCDFFRFVSCPLSAGGFRCRRFLGRGFCGCGELAAQIGGGVAGLALALLCFLRCGMRLVALPFHRANLGGELGNLLAVRLRPGALVPVLWRSLCRRYPAGRSQRIARRALDPCPAAPAPARRVRLQAVGMPRCTLPTMRRGSWQLPDRVGPALR